MSKGEKNRKTNLVSLKVQFSNLKMRSSDRGRKSNFFTDMFPSMPKGEIVGIIDYVFSLMET
jgi:hypothetical protein